MEARGIHQHARSQIYHGSEDTGQREGPGFNKSLKLTGYLDVLVTFLLHIFKAPEKAKYAEVLFCVLGVGSNFLPSSCLGGSLK